MVVVALAAAIEASNPYRLVTGEDKMESPSRTLSRVCITSRLTFGTSPRRLIVEYVSPLCLEIDTRGDVLTLVSLHLPVIPVRGPGQSTPSPTEYTTFLSQSQASHTDIVEDDNKTPTTATSAAGMASSQRPAAAAAAAHVDGVEQKPQGTNGPHNRVSHLSDQF